MGNEIWQKFVKVTLYVGMMKTIVQYKEYTSTGALYIAQLLGQSFISSHFQDLRTFHLSHPGCQKCPLKGEVCTDPFQNDLLQMCPLYKGTPITNINHIPFA